jgi:hypothetical protein
MKHDDIDAPIKCPNGWTSVRELTTAVVADMRSDGYTDDEINARLEFSAWRRSDGGPITVAEIDAEAAKSEATENGDEA